MGHFEKNNFDQDLGLGTIQIRDHLRNGLARLFIRYDDQAASFRIYRDHRVAHVPIRWVSAGARAARGIGTLATGSRETTAGELSLCLHRKKAQPN